MKCQTCSHPQREAIDLALLTENHTFAYLSQQYGLSTSSLFRHKKHLAEKMRRAEQRLRDSQDQVSLLKLNAFLDHVQRAVQAAELEGNIDQVLKGAQVGSRIIRQISQMDVPLGLDMVYRLISSPQFVTRDSLLPTGPEIITGIHQSIAEAALFPCPDPEPALVADEAENDVETEMGEAPQTKPAAKNSLRTQNSELRTQNPEPRTQTLLQEVLAALLADPEISPEIKREKTAKIPLQSSLGTEKIYENQIDNQCKNNLAKNSDAGRESELHHAGCLDGDAAENSESIFLETRNSEPETQYNCCIVPLKTDRYRRRGIF